MNTNVIFTALLALVIVVFIFARQIIQQPLNCRESGNKWLVEAVMMHINKIM